MEQRDYQQLTKYERNDLFRVLASGDLPITEFEVTTHMARRALLKRPPQLVTVIRHPNSRSAFGIIRQTPMDFWIRQAVQTDQAIEKLFASDPPWRPSGYPSSYSWEMLLDEVRGWARTIATSLQAVDEYEQTPDLWDELYQSKEFLTGQHGQDFEDSPFTSAEQNQISQQIRQIKAYVKETYNLSSEQMSHMEAKLDQAEEASHRIGRKDWLLLFYGAVSSLVLSDLIPPPAGRHILLLTIHGLGHLFGIGGPPPHLPPVG